MRDALARVMTDTQPQAKIAPHAATDETATSIPPAWQEHYEERAAIVEYDGELHREEAEAFARAEVLHLSRGKALPTHPATCAACGKADWLVCLRTEDDRTWHVQCWKAQEHSAGEK
ncbi:hypothetical protein [Pararhodobacter sp.]|uniref:hypothetical protein n=1 Tax=Pararhodobacter sp. TaxID=2127056 RepID=UPI002AFE6A5E|nr:hypothetical protein [Pararhodobacter sp.]